MSDHAALREELCLALEREALREQIRQKDEEIGQVREVLNTDLKIAQDRVLTLELENQRLKAVEATHGTGQETLHQFIEEWNALADGCRDNAVACGALLRCADQLASWLTEDVHATEPSVVVARTALETEDASTKAKKRDETVAPNLCCINCGQDDDGAYEVGNEQEAFAGPFCSACYYEIECCIAGLFVHDVNAAAEADMLAGGPITGAHHRAIGATLTRWRKDGNLRRGRPRASHAESDV